MAVGHAPVSGCTSALGLENYVQPLEEVAVVLLLLRLDLPDIVVRRDMGCGGRRYCFEGGDVDRDCTALLTWEGLKNRDSSGHRLRVP